MNISVANNNMTGVPDYRDSFTKAVIKNVIVVVLSISINYINAGLIHTFCGNQVIILIIFTAFRMQLFQN